MISQTSIHPFFDENTGTLSYVIAESGGKHAAVVDPVLDFDVRSGRTATSAADKILAHVRSQGLVVDWILETHAHADHLSGARYLQELVGGRIAIGEHIRQVQATFKKLYNLERDFLPDGSQFDHLFKDGEKFNIGQVEAKAMRVPGHTPADMAYVVDDAVFVGDTLFMPDVGSARTDFPGGDAHLLYRSMRRILALPPLTRLFVCHDYPPQGRPVRCETTVAEQRAHNIHVHDGVTEEAFVAMRTARDATLDVPMLILPALQVNVRAGRLPPAESDGVSYLKIPLNVLSGGAGG
jgi:glyoxylase-like metal-dependent hydrolase (beta-lactamase superfamily II)